jgi:hypothetical protein
MPTIEFSLSPKEKKRLELFLRNLQKLAPRRGRLTKTYDFIMRQQMKEVLKILGIPYPTKRLIAEALVVMGNPYPFKKYQLRKLLKDERRRQPLP